MNKTACFTLLLLLAGACLRAQTCVRDSTVLTDTMNLLAPPPWTPEFPNYNLNEACINQPYNQSVTLEVPAEVTLQGITAPLSSLTLATSGAIDNLPAGITYLCDPPNCVFNANTLGCILLYGTPNMPAPTLPDTFDLVVNVVLFTPLIPGVPFPVQFPGDFIPGNYYLILNPAGTSCMSSAFDPGSRIASLKNAPNPFDAETRIEVESMVSGNFYFEVTNLLGQRVHEQTVALSEGPNQFTFHAGHLPNGSYLYALSNSEGRSASRMVIAR
ncbi:MAG: T9SS type A sorting domain-containing protein [Saprospiraceae bacterium]|nr:T9SS type A sorting domain-containing protein [Saprospiraceae bacterium]